MNNKIITYLNVSQKVFHCLERIVPCLGTDRSMPWNGSFHALERIIPLLLLFMMLILGGGNVWGQTYKYYAIHNKDKGYLKQLNGAVAIDATFRYENSHDTNGSSIWVLSSDGYLQQEMYYLNVANDQTLYLSTEKVTQWTIDYTTASGKNYLKPNGSSKFLCADNGPQLKDSPSNYLNACEMTIVENDGKWEGPKDVSFTVQSPQLVTYLRTYYIRKITATITKDDAGSTNKKVVDKKDSRCFCSLTYSTTTDTKKGTNWDVNETSGVIYSKQVSGDYSVAATYSVAPLDPVVISSHPATNQTVTLMLQPSPFAPDTEKKYLLFNTKEENYRFPYDDGLSENDAVKTNASKSVLTEPLTSPNNNISWKIVRDDEGFYSFRNINSGRWLRYDGSHYVAGSDYGVIEMGVNDDATPVGNEYKFRLYKSGTYKSTNTAPTYCILPYSKQYAIYKSDGAATNALVAMSVYTTPKVISLGKTGDDSKYCIFAYEAEYRIYGGFTLSGPNSAIATGDYVFKTTESYSSRNIVGSPSNNRDLEIKDSYKNSDISFIWQVQGLDGFITIQTPTVSKGAGTETVTVNSLPSGMRYGKVRVQAKSGSSTGGINGENNQKWSGWKELEFNLYSEPSYTDITSLSQITSPDGYYRLTADVSDTPGVTEFSGFLDGNMHKISGVSAPLFTTLTGTVKNVILDNVSINGSGNTGAIACTANGAARIYNVGILSGSVSGTGYTGGLVGFLDGTARVINCYSYANITGGSTVGGIVGYNNVATTAASIKTMVMNCMFYGNITGGTTKSPVYGGLNINNNQGGLNTFNYYSYENLTGGVTDNQYNCALAVEEKYLNRFEFYRLLLNSNKKLAAYYATGSAQNGDKMAKWVLETADRTIENPKPYPILKSQGYYPSIINIDAENAPQLILENDKPKEEDRNKGGKLGKTLTVHIGGVGSNAPNGASILRRGAIKLQRTDKDFERFNYNYDKVQLPYYNDVGTGNYTGNRVVTGWKITAITAVEDDPYTAENYPTSGITDYPNHNYADRKSSNKDLYSVSKRVFSQGAYFDVPYGVTSITIEPYWANAVYVADQYYDVVYKNDYTGKQGVSQVGTQAVDNTTEFNGQKVRTSITGLGSGATVYDNAVVLVGNFHLDNVPSGGTTPFTMMSVDQDNDHEPDYSLIYHHKNRVAICPIRFDFLNIPGTAQAQKPKGASLICNFTIFKTKGWFEVTNTSSFYTSQLEYENLASITKSDAPLILQGGVIDQFVSTQSSAVNGNTIYIHLGGNVWINEFGMGTHSDGSQSTPHVPVSVTGGEFPGFYLTGTYKADANVRSDNAECYISGGYFHEVAGASLEQINGNVRWQIYNADIDNFFGGGINDAKPITGDITTDIYNSYVTLFCGGPKFGNMQTGKNVVTRAEGCTFGKFFGAGYGGTSLAKKKYYDLDGDQNWATLQGYYTTDRGKYFDGITTKSSYVSGKDYGKKGPGVATDFDYEFFVWTSGATGARLYVNFASFSLAQCNDVSSTLKKCTVEENFYGGGNLGKVVGTATSVLEDCMVNGSVYGAGYSASLPTVEVRDAGFITDPNYNSQSGMFEPGVFSGTTTFTWQNATKAGKTLTNGQSGSDLDNHILYTNTELTGLGEVALTNLTIKGTTTVAGSVYGGGEESGVGGDTEVTVTGGTIGTTGSGGALYGNVYGGGKGKEDDVTAGLVKGNTNISISGSPTILHNVYGGGAYGSVGTFTYNATTGFPTSCVENTGVANVTITGGTLGSNGKENGMVFGSSRGLEGDPETNNLVDKMAWVANTNVIIGTQNAESNANPWIKGSVYGGGENGHNLQDAHVTVHSGTIGITDSNTDGGARYPYRGNVYGAGCGTDTYTKGEGDDKKIYYDFNAGIVQGNTRIDIDGGHIVHNVYGGGAMGSVGKYTFADAAYHAEHSEVPVGMPYACAENTGTCTINITGGQIGITNATMTDHGADGPDDLGHVFGAGRGTSADPVLYPNVETTAFFNNTDVTIAGNAFVCGSVYGGSESGHVLNNTNVIISGGQIGCGEGKDKAYTDEEFASSTSLAGTNHWTYTAGGAGKPYDQYADETGYDAKGGATTGTDGRTFFGNVFAGGSGYYPYAPGKWLKSAGHIGGTASVTVSGGHILNNLYGGCEMADIKGAVTVTMTGGTIGVPRTQTDIEDNPNSGNIYGGGMGDKRIFFNTSTNVASTTVNISNGTVYGAVYGGGEDGHVIDCAVTTISQPEGKTTVIGCNGLSGYDGNVFGAGQGHVGALTSGVVGGNASLTITGGTLKGSAYGGGRIASVGTFFASADDENYGKMQEGENHGCLTVNLTGGTIYQNVYGGCMGTTEGLDYGVSKNVSVELNNGVDDDAKGCVVLGSIFGCNNVNSSPEGTSTVHIYKTQRNGASRITNTEEVTDAKVQGSKDENGEYILNTFDVPAVYGGGNLAAYTPKDANGTTNVIIEGCSSTSIGQVYGGGNAASTPATSVTIKSTFEIGELFGGGNGKDDLPNGDRNPGANVGYKDYHLVEKDPAFATKEARVSGDAFAAYRYGTGLANVTVKGGTIHRVFGGSNTKGNVRETALTMLEEVTDEGVALCDFHVDEAYGGGKSAPMDAEAKLLMACIPGLEEVYGGAQAADIKDNVTLTITNGTFDRVFGGNNLSGTISGKITVNVEETGCRPIIIGELYGGGNLAAYSIYGYNVDGTPKESGDDPFDDPVVNVRSFTSIGTVYGGGYGVAAVMVGSPTVNINEVADPNSEAQTKSYTEDDVTKFYSDYAGETKTIDGHEVILPSHAKGKIGAINDVFGGGNAASVKGDTHVNIGTAIGDDVYMAVIVETDATLTGNGYYTRSGAGTTTNPYTYTTATGTAVEGTTYYKKYEVIGVDIRGNVYGGGNNAKVTGNTNVVIGKDANN